MLKRSWKEFVKEQVKTILTNKTYREKTNPKIDYCGSAVEPVICVKKRSGMKRPNKKLNALIGGQVPVLDQLIFPFPLLASCLPLLTHFRPLPEKNHHLLALHLIRDWRLPLLHHLTSQ